MSLENFFHVHHGRMTRDEAIRDGLTDTATSLGVGAVISGVTYLSTQSLAATGVSATVGEQPQHPLWLELWPCTAVTRSIAFAGLLNQVHRCLHTRQMWLSPTKRAQLKDSYESCRSLQGDLACLPLPRTVTSDPGRESESFLPGPTRAPQSENQFRSDPRHDGCMVADGSSPTRRPNVPAASIRGPHRPAVRKGGVRCNKDEPRVVHPVPCPHGPRIHGRSK